ncbi:MAG: BlaI/MecI/CopY family transcriptional regulator [Myxococcaceae bacterium]|nr:MAG: BlaI/MecI/CopY family transcriptional regulator [Myxococcaceae bacterium]
MPLPLLGELELAVLRYVWANGTVDAKAIHRDLGAPREITINTVQSTVERLHRKRLLIRERVSHAYQYAPALSREEFRARAVADVAGELRGAEGARVIAAFVELAARADGENIDRIASMIELARSRREGR